jgi:hypothetical protein
MCRSGLLVWAILLQPLLPQRALGASTAVPAGLIAWWPGDGTPINLAGSPAVMQGGAAFTAGMVAQAFRFNGTNQWAATDLDAQPSALPTTSWELWVFPTRVKASTRQHMLSCDTGGYGRSVLIESGTTNFGVFVGNGVWQPTLVTTNAWQHIVVIYSPTNVLFYKNGVRFSYGKAPGIQSSSQKLTIGRNPGYGEYFAGDIDEVTIYNRTLTDGEIQAIYDAGSAGKLKAGNGTADLAVSIHSSPSYVTLSQNLTNVIQAANQGPDLALATSLSVTLPTNATFVSAQTSQGNWFKSGNLLYCQWGDLPAGQSPTFTVVLAPNSTGTVTQTASVSSLASDPNPSNNAAKNDTTIYAHFTATDGDWAALTLVLTNTPEADLMVRTGDIDNLGFGWPIGLNPFSGNSTPSHTFPWTVDTNDPAGTDRIMVITSYNGHPPSGQDGYSTSTSRPANQVQAIVLTYDLHGRPVNSAALQIFVDDFQAPIWKASYQASLNGVRAPFLETIINSLYQTGPVGKLISVGIPTDYLDLVRSGRLEVKFDDLTTAAGDGYAIDFVKMLINVKSFTETGVIHGYVVDAANQLPIVGAQVSAGGMNTAVTDGSGHYLLTNVAAGLVFVQASHIDCGPLIKSTDLVSGQTNPVDFALAVQARLRIQKVGDHAVVSWPATLTGYILQTTLTLQSPITWTPEGSTPANLNGRSTVNQALDHASQYYRLVKP